MADKKTIDVDVFEKRIVAAVAAVVAELETHPTSIKLREVKKKMSELGADKASKVQQLAEEEEEQRKSIAGSREARLGPEVDALLEGRKLPDNQTREKLRHELDVIDLAIEKQQQVIADLRGEFSAVVCNHPENRAIYIAIQRRLATAVAEVAAANEAEEEFLAKLYEMGCSSVAFRPMRIREIGTLDDPHSRASAHRRELEQFVPEAV
jgi:hypothetical protein